MADDNDDVVEESSPKGKDKAKKNKREPVRLKMVDTHDKAALNQILGAVQVAFKDAPGVASVNPGESDAEIYSTGILSLDRALGVNGLLGGRIVNCFGEAGTGKTLTAMMVGGAIQRAGGLVAFLDAEGTFSPKFATACGLDVTQLIYVRSTPERVMAGEDFFEVLRVLVAQGVHFIIVDSGAALVPSQKLSLSFGEGQQATQARLFSEELQKVTSYLSASQRTIVWFTNQMRSNPMAMFGPKDGSTGGKALEFYASYNFMMTKVEDMKAKVIMPHGKAEEKIVGVSVKLFIKKNKTAAKPVEPIQFDVYTEFATLEDGSVIEPGVNTLKDYFQTGKALGMIEQKFSWFSFMDVRGNGEKDFCTALRKDPATMDALRAKCLGIGAPQTTTELAKPTEEVAKPE